MDRILGQGLPHPSRSEPVHPSRYAARGRRTRRGSAGQTSDPNPPVSTPPPHHDQLRAELPLPRPIHGPRLSAAVHDRRLAGVQPPVVEVEGVLVGVQPLLRHRLQHLQLARSGGPSRCARSRGPHAGWDARSGPQTPRWRSSPSARGPPPQARRPTTRFSAQPPTHHTEPATTPRPKSPSLSQVRSSPLRHAAQRVRSYTTSLDSSPGFRR